MKGSSSEYLSAGVGVTKMTHITHLKVAGNEYLSTGAGVGVTHNTHDTLKGSRQ